MPEISPVGENYKPETQRLIDTYQSGRGVEEYAKILGFRGKPALLNHLPQNALILDVGSGFGNFAKNLYLLRQDINTVNLNPALSKSSFVESQKKDWFIANSSGINIFRRSRIHKAQKAHDAFSVSGMNPGLPFKTNSFDAVFDSMSSIYYATPHKGEVEMVGEVIRVLKSGGFAAIGPVVSDTKYYEIEKYLRNAKGIVFKTGGIETEFGWGGAFFRINKR